MIMIMVVVITLAIAVARVYGRVDGLADREARHAPHDEDGSSGQHGGEPADARVHEARLALHPRAHAGGQVAVAGEVGVGHGGLHEALQAVELRQHQHRGAAEEQADDTRAEARGQRDGRRGGRRARAAGRAGAAGGEELGDRQGGQREQHQHGEADEDGRRDGEVAGQVDLLAHAVVAVAGIGVGNVGADEALTGAVAGVEAGAGDGVGGFGAGGGVGGGGDGAAGPEGRAVERIQRGGPLGDGDVLAVEGFLVGPVLIGDGEHGQDEGDDGEGDGEEGEDGGERLRHGERRTVRCALHRVPRRATVVCVRRVFGTGGTGSVISRSGLMDRPAALVDEKTTLAPSSVPKSGVSARVDGERRGLRAAAEGGPGRLKQREVRMRPAQVRPATEPGGLGGCRPPMEGSKGGPPPGRAEQGPGRLLGQSASYLQEECRARQLDATPPHDVP